MIIATSGHVDHGKTRLVHALTGVDTDRLEEEQQRGLTIDLGFAYADFGDHRLGFIDVPGHIRFIDNMLAGVSIIDFGLLVIAADDGPMPQTREHLAIMELLQLSDGAVVLTKIDRVSDARIAEVTDSIRRLLEDTVLAGKPIFAVSSVTGAGIGDLRDALTAAAGRIAARSTVGHFRLAIDRAFTIKGAGLVVTGSVFSGTVAEGGELVLTPQNLPVRVRAIHRQNRPAPEGRAGDRCSLNITGAGLTREMVHRGDWLTTNPAPPTSRADALIRVLATETRPLRHWTPVHIHCAANHLTGRVATLDTDSIEPGAQGLVQLILSRPVNLCRGDRLILRDQAASTTIGGGVIVDPASPARGRAKPQRLRELGALLAASPRERLLQSLALQPAGLRAGPFRDAENLTEAQWRDLLRQLPARVIQDDWMITEEHVDALGKRLLDELAAWHRTHSQASGVSRRQLQNLPGLDVPDPILDAVVTGLNDAGKLAVKGNTFALPDHDIALSPQEARLWAQIEPVLAREGTRPPVVHDLAKQLSLPHGAVQNVLIQCARLGYVVRPVANRFFLPQAIASLRRLVLDVSADAEDGMFSVKTYRDASGIGRNLSIEILEYFDRTGLTLRVGEKRKLAKPRNDDLYDQIG